MSNTVEVDTVQGKLSGNLLEDGSRSFKGIPYAQAPVGDLRLRRSVPHAGWEGVLNCQEYRACSLQNHDAKLSASDLYPGGLSEDCLHLNIWTPEVNSTEQRFPVFFWIHGGGFTVGSSSEPIYDGAAIAAQGIVAGINSSLRIQSKDLWVPKRSDAYIGVLIDDLVSRGTIEPYRMFTSRAEYRLILREDNADRRLSCLAKEFGLISKEQWDAFVIKNELIKKLEGQLTSIKIRPNSENGEKFAKETGESLKQCKSLKELLIRPNITIKNLDNMFNFGAADYPDSVVQQVEIDSLYAGYIDRQKKEIAQAEARKEVFIPNNFNYNSVKGLSNEALQKFIEFQPATLTQAARISGITPVAISLLNVYLKKSEQSLIT